MQSGMMTGTQGKSCREVFPHPPALERVDLGGVRLGEGKIKREKVATLPPTHTPCTIDYEPPAPLKSPESPQRLAEPRRQGLVSESGRTER